MEALQAQIEERLAAEEAPPAAGCASCCAGRSTSSSATHPTLTMVLGRILDSLNKMGI
jgi:hypothetical protein